MSNDKLALPENIGRLIAAMTLNKDVQARARFGVKLKEALLAHEAEKQAEPVAIQASAGISIPDGYCAVLVPEGEAPPEPDWDEVKRQAEAVTGLKVEQHTFSIIIREVRRWIAHAFQATAAAPAAPPDSDKDDAERWRTFIGLDYQVRAEWAANLSLVPVLQSWVDAARAKKEPNAE